MWRYVLALGAAVYLGLWFVGADHGQQRWGLRDTPTPLVTPQAPGEPAPTEVSAITPATPLVSPPAAPADGPVAQPLVPQTPFSAEAQSAAATTVEPEPEVFTLGDPAVAASALDQHSLATPPRHSALADAMSQDPFPSAEAQPPAVATPAPTPPPANARTIIGRAVNLRKGPSNAELAIATLFRGDVVEVLSETLNGWARVRSLTDGSEGYVSTRFLSAGSAN